MNMEGKRFLAGILGGVLFGLAIVAYSGFTFSIAASVVSVPMVPANQGQGVTSTTQTVSSSTTSLATAGSANATASVPAYAVSTTTTGNQSATSQYTSGGAINNLSGSFSSQSRATDYSRLDNILAQPAPFTIIVFVPVLLAVLVGLVLYRTSAGKLAKD